MKQSDCQSVVRTREEFVTIPTYPPPAPDLNPMFLEKRVYQGSSGKVYPNPFTDRVSTEKKNRQYRAVFLENEYVKLMILPEIGGRIHIGLDKTNGYDFFYRQNVIKPALVGLLGPWISGGVEFNWPQHHRPSTFMPVDHYIEEHVDGSRTVWLSEHEPMNRMKGMVGICLRPGKSRVEAKVRLYNRTPFVQTFLWWANVAVRVHEQYQAFFPPDVTYVADHAKRATSEFPIAKGFYYGVDYTCGVDIRWYKNIPVPTSYMVVESRHNFFGGYDHARQAGLVHVADHHISPGKKLWTWGNAEFGYAWDRELTDSDGPYIELMAGVYTDNQPDFSFLQPFETRTFSQYWYPIQQIGPAKNANELLAVNLEVSGRKARAGACSSEALPDACVVLTAGDRVLMRKTGDLAPGAPCVAEVDLPEDIAETDLVLAVRDRQECELICYRPEKLEPRRTPEAATEPPPLEQMASTDELYLTGLHLEQYRHATRSPESYWQEALRRDPGDARNNNALGLVHLRRGEFKRAEQYFRQAILRLTRRNPNPYDGEPYYHLGLALKYQGHLSEAYDALYKAAWNYAWQSAAYYALAEIDCSRRDYLPALDHLDGSLAANIAHLKARNLKAAILRRLNRHDEAETLARGTVSIDPLDFWSRNELVLVRRARGDSEGSENCQRELSALMRNEAQSHLDIAFDYAGAGLFEEASELLERLVESRASGVPVYPTVLYSLGFFCQQTSNFERAHDLCRQACQAPSDYCFPARLEEMIVLESAQAANPNDAKAAYYLGNLLYDKRRYEDAIQDWERSSALDPSFSITWRNLGIAYFNIRHEPARAAECYRRAFAANPRDARLLFEMDQLAKRLGVPPEERLALLDQHRELVSQRDDLIVELVTLYNQVGKSTQALEVLRSRRFHPWEGGEGLVSGQYVWTHALLGLECLEVGNPKGALTHFEAAGNYPENLGEGKHLLTPENHLHYFAGLAWEALGDYRKAAESFERGAKKESSITPMSYYRALSLRKLGQQAAATTLLNEILEFATQQLNAECKIDYFATSLPNFLLFEDDLRKRIRVDCRFLVGLAHLGLGEIGEAEAAFREVLALDINHLGAMQKLRWLRSDAKAVRPL